MIYLDHHAAAPITAVAQQAMDAARAFAWANPSSVHRAGRRSRQLLEQARSQVAAAIGAAAADIVLTGGGTEACNLGVLGLQPPREGRTFRRVYCSPLEHPGTEEAVTRLVAAGSERCRLDWQADPQSALSAIEANDLVVMQGANHETGNLLPVAAVARCCRAAGATLFVDATQLLGKVSLDVDRLKAHAVALSSSKIGGPAGAGALWLDRQREVVPLFSGGRQERGRRPGSPNTLGHVGFGAACGEIEHRLALVPEIAARRDRLERALERLGARVNGGEGPRVATASNVSWPGWKGEELVAALDVEGLCTSSGAACSSGLAEPSRVLQAMYPREPWRADSAVRFSLGPTTTDADIEGALEIVARVTARQTSTAAGA